MASTARVSYLTIDGAQYAVARDGAQSSVKRSHQAIEPAQLSGLRVQPPFLTSETQGFEDGEGLRTRDDIATGYYGGLGMEPHTEVPTTGHLRLKVGRALTDLLGAQAGWGGIGDLIVFHNELLVAPLVDNSFWSWDGTTLTEHDFSVSVVGNMTRFVIDERLDEVYFGSDNGEINRWTGAVFGNVVTVGTRTVSPIGVFLAAAESTIWWWATDATDTLLGTKTRVGGVTTTRMTWAGQNISCGLIHGGTVYVWVYDAGDTRQPRATLCTWSADASGSLGQGLLRFDDNYPVSMVVYKGEIFLGMAWGGSVRKMTSTTSSEEVLHVGATAAPATVPGSDAIYALRVFGGFLYAAGYDAAAPSGQRTWLRRYDGTGWHPISAGGNDASTAIRSLYPFQQTLCLGDSEASDARLVQLSTTSRLTAARLDTAAAVFGATGIRKRFVRASLQHGPLVAGQAIELRTVLDDGAESSVGTNRDAGSAETVFVLPATVLGTRLQCRWYLTNIVGSDLLLASDSVTALPAPPSREVWQAELQLAADAYDAADTRTELDRYAALQALQDAGAVFQVVHEYRDANGVPLLAMRAAFDPQVPLETRDLGIGGGAMSAVAPVRLVQATQPENLLLNASFEQDAAGAAPTGWSATGTGTSSNVSAAVTPVDGANVLAVVFDGASATYGRTQSISGLTPGRYYTLSGHIRRATTGAGNVKLNALEGAILDASTAALAAATDAAFIRYSVTFLLPLTSSGTISVRLLGSSTPAGTAYFDAVMLEEGAPASTFRERGSGG